jgi:hypothetical protein
MIIIVIFNLIIINSINFIISKNERPFSAYVIINMHLKLDNFHLLNLDLLLKNLNFIILKAYFKLLTFEFYQGYLIMIKDRNLKKNLCLHSFLHYYYLNYFNFIKNLIK